MTQPEVRRGWIAARAPLDRPVSSPVQDSAKCLSPNLSSRSPPLSRFFNSLKLKEVYCALSTPAGCRAVTGPAGHNLNENR
jgi:hypothetical protein